jgi:hypothetical protein
MVDSKLRDAQESYAFAEARAYLPRLVPVQLNVSQLPPKPLELSQFNTSNMLL